MTAPGLLPTSVDHPTRGTARPAAVTTIATIGVIFGTFGLLCKPVLIAMALFLKLPTPDPTLAAVQNSPVLRAFTVVDGLTGTFMSLLLLMAAIGSLPLKPWARLGMLSYAVLALVLTVLVQLVGYFVLNPEMEQAFRNVGAAPTPQQAWAQSYWVAGLNLVARFWFPLVILFYYNRRDIKEAFALGLAKVDI